MKLNQDTLNPQHLHLIQGFADKPKPRRNLVELMRDKREAAQIANKHIQDSVDMLLGHGSMGQRWIEAADGQYVVERSEKHGKERNTRIAFTKHGDDKALIGLEIHSHPEPTFILTAPDAEREGSYTRTVFSPSILSENYDDLGRIEQFAAQPMYAAMEVRTAEYAQPPAVVA